MNVNLINPFLKSVHNVMETMLQVTPVQSAPFAKKNNLTNGDISGIIGFAEKKCSGAVVLSFPKPTALKVFRLLTGLESNRLGGDVQDAIGEMANMVAGGAKSEFSKDGISFHLSIPTVVVGQNHIMSQLAENPVIVVPLSLDNEKFFLEVSMQLDVNGKQEK